MKKILFFVLALALLPVWASAQETRMFKYQGEVALSGAFCLDNEEGSFNVEIVNGIRFSRYLFVGVGVGVSASLEDEAVKVPLYVDVKGYMPVTKCTDLFAGIDLGTKLDYDYGLSGGLMLRPEFGLHFQFNEKLGLNVALFYERYSFKMQFAEYGVDAWTNNVGLKLGFHF